MSVEVYEGRRDDYTSAELLDDSEERVIYSTKRQLVEEQWEEDGKARGKENDEDATDTESYVVVASR